MNIELFVLCDAATDQQGKLNILGAFDSLWAQKVPVSHPQCAVALRIRFSKIEEGEHNIRINVIDEDGHSVVAPFETKVSVGFAKVKVTSVAANMILNLHGLKFQQFGEYSIDLAIDGRHESSLPFYVNQLPGQAKEN